MKRQCATGTTAIATVFKIMTNLPVIFTDNALPRVTDKNTLHYNDILNLIIIGKGLFLIHITIENILRDIVSLANDCEYCSYVINSLIISKSVSILKKH